MLQTLNQHFQPGIARRRPTVQPVEDLHVRQAQQALQRRRLARLKCSAVRRPKATQPEIQLQQPAPAAPGHSIRHDVSPAAT